VKISRVESKQTFPRPDIAEVVEGVEVNVRKIIDLYNMNRSMKMWILKKTTTCPRRLNQPFLFGGANTGEGAIRFSVQRTDLAKGAELLPKNSGWIGGVTWSPSE